MPRYYFELVDGGRESYDRGTELPDLDAARLAAIVFAGEYISDCQSARKIDPGSASNVDPSSGSSR
jgi:hypothetical protein